jgi:membrane-bound metal-dependent hydrolase YbcI (DUF457 family)
MDILSHGLWGGIAFGRKSRRSFWLAFAIGLAPDLLSFGILWTAVILGLADPPDFSHGTPPESTIPPYVHHLYDVTHSFLVFLFVFLLIWFATKRPRWEVAAWGLHVLVDVPTHSHASHSHTQLSLARAALRVVPIPVCSYRSRPARLARL